jgi:dienelactone hydrolase
VIARRRLCTLRPLAGLACLAFAATLAQSQNITGGQRVSLAVDKLGGGREDIVAYAFAPPRAPAGARLAALVIVHGPAGVTDATEGFWGRSLAAAGMAALVIDSFTPRGVANTIEDQSRVSTSQMVRDAFGALDYLARQPFVDAHRIALMGMSKGGAVAVLAADQRVHGGQQAFAAHVALYPVCTVQFRNPQVSAPLLMLIGEQDNYTGVKTCADYAGRIRAAGGRAELKTYKGAHHGFDGDSSEPGEIRLQGAQNLRECLLYNEDDGRTVFAKTGKVLETPKQVLETLQRDCMTRGATVAANARVKQQALEDVKAFLKATVNP